MIEINLEKELEMYFYNKGLGSESRKEAADMVAFLKTLLNKRLKDIEDFTENLMDDMFTLRKSLFNNQDSQLSEEN